MCGGIQEKQPHDKFDWDRRRTPTSSGGTGPSIGYGGKGMENKTGQKQIELKKRILVRNLCSAARFKNY